MKPALLLLALMAISCPSGKAQQTSQVTQTPDVNALLQKLIAADETERRVVMDELDQIQDPKILVPPLLAALDTVDPKEAWKLLDVLSRFPEATKPEPLIRLAQRSEVVPNTLTTQISSLGARARPSLIKAISDACTNWQPVPENTPAEDSGNQELKEGSAKAGGFMRWAATTLSQTGSQGVDTLLKKLHDRDACHRTAAADGLIGYAMSYGPELKAQVVPAISAALRDHDVLVQRAAVTVLEPIIGYNLAPLSTQMIAALFSILKANPDAEARNIAFRMLRHTTPATARKAAEIARHDSNEELQNAAEQFLDELSDPPQTRP
jgi:hypothetical protein